MNSDYTDLKLGCFNKISPERIYFSIWKLFRCFYEFHFLSQCVNRVVNPVPGPAQLQLFLLFRHTSNMAILNIILNNFNLSIKDKPEQNKKELIKEGMNSSEIIKRRLTELKKMSVQLKQSTQNTSQVDYNIVYGILQATKSSASKMTELSVSVAKNNDRNNSPLSRLLAMNSSSVQPYRSLFPQTLNQQSKGRNRMNLNGSPLKIKTHGLTHAQATECQEQYFGNSQQNLEQQANNFIAQIGFEDDVTSPSGYNPRIHKPQCEEQIVCLRDENNELQKTISHLRHQLQQLKEKLQTVNEQQQWKAGLPFFRLNQKVDAFYTRMNIQQDDYHKIQYGSFNAQLSLDKLMVNKSSGMGTTKELDLTELRQVHYIDSIIILLHFGGVGGLQRNNVSSVKDQADRSDKYSTEDFFENLFVRFKNQEQLHRWDLALFVNFKIMDSLKKDKLFSGSLMRSKSKSRKISAQSKYYNDSNKKPKKSSDSIYEDDQDLMKRLIQRRDLYLQTKKMVSQRMIQKVNQKKSLQSSNGKKSKEIDYDADQHSETHSFQIKDESLINRSVFSNIMRGDENLRITEMQERANTSKFKDFASGQNSLNLNSVQNIIIPSLNIGASSLNERDLSFNPDQYQLSLNKKLQQQRIREANEVKKINDLKNQRIKKAIKRLTQQGYDLTKYSKDGFNPHEKRVFLSQDLSKFCWEQQGKDKKQIQIKSIKEVQFQKIGQGIRKHIKKPKKEQHCIISYVKDGKLKVIQLGSNSTTMAQLVDQLITVIDYLKQKGGKNQ